MLRKDLDDFWANGEVGDWTFTSDECYLVVRLHSAEDDGVAAVPIKPDSDIPGKPVWQWNGSREAPTLSPSIRHHSKPEWHGWLRDGKLVLA